MHDVVTTVVVIAKTMVPIAAAVATHSSCSISVPARTAAVIMAAGAVVQWLAARAVNRCCVAEMITSKGDRCNSVVVPSPAGRVSSL